MLRPADILMAHRRMAGIVYPTPLEFSRPLANVAGAEVFLKLECAQVTGSFKIRGAASALLSGEGRWPVVACSAGNHALGIAYAAAHAGIDATLVLPENASPAKIQALQRYPVNLLFLGKDYDEAEAAAMRLAHEEGQRFISPYNHPDVIAGQGTLGREILDQLPNAEVLVVSVGGGGLISGIGIWAKAINPKLRIIGVQAEHSAAMHASLQAGQLVQIQHRPTLADSLAGNLEAGAMTFPLVQQLVERIVLVSEPQIAAAMRWLLDEHHLLVEGSAAVTIAALLEGMIPGLARQRVVALLCGRNVTTETVCAVMHS
ncbi:threonine/serine dehydratase [Candidatus Chloroploca sp. M-50]|uniref:Threonine/serine dehydratase n=1 Tax=Candidatus Chloroploca mongolica TaxID=2528176 RepID=A0ABS4DD90_9CHLR|nr:threonine/serine dehydratase [Candidatus Chloroploca mongolica]MBP1467420.1 threonine/serine dehydratase [Candidatus Chloroploca mongolica]